MCGRKGAVPGTSKRSDFGTEIKKRIAMKKNRYGYQMDDDEHNHLLSDEETSTKETDDVEYEFEGYEVEISTKVALMPKTTAKP
jgi:hypothetical protein